MIAKSSGSAATNIPMVDGEGALTLHSVSTGVETGDPTAVLEVLSAVSREQAAARDLAASGLVVGHRAHKTRVALMVT